MQVKECYVQTKRETAPTNNYQPCDVVYMLPSLQRKREKERKRIPFHGIPSKLCPLNITILHQSYIVSLKANNHNNHRRKVKYMTKHEEINTVPITELSDWFCHTYSHFNKTVNNITK
jgi:N6-adenosine-specific RNA methylase IME4